MGIKAKPDDIAEGGLYRDTWTLEDGKLWRDRQQTNRLDILRANEVLRRSEAKKLDGMRWALRIPEDDYVALRARDPELASNERAVRDRAWAAFLASDASIPYRVYTPSGRGRTA